MFLGSVTGGNLGALPQTAVERLRNCQLIPCWVPYNLDLLNFTNR